MASVRLWLSLDVGEGSGKQQTSNVSVIIYKLGRHIGVIIYTLIRELKCKQ